ncbi:hypothetical protein AVL62_09770 [Serinicoccus chungangensis]|uniref:Uncharacterized protein n=1 Tax=Serinicoccus chungangensis TaxID=767452 RepID=A0A0W8I1I8_9MICO|nr:hypothetical protein [Serinicoccus chungangensis]KUG51595.1 hypothetical protein AVL62_09770 [Serinicoccus chungangensis]
MLALVLAMLMCVALGAGVVGYVMIEARREGRGQFWTPEGEELIAGARRRGEQVRSRGEQLGRSAAERTQSIRQPRRQPAPAARADAPAPEAAPVTPPVTPPAAPPAQQGAEDAPGEDTRAEEYRAAS